MSFSQEKVTLRIEGIGPIPSFKNAKRVFVNQRTKKPFLGTQDDVKERMQRLEDAIVFQLYSLCQTGSGETVSECRKRLRTVLSGLSDDSLNQIPAGSFDVEFVEKGREGVQIEIEYYD